MKPDLIASACLVFGVAVLAASMLMAKPNGFERQLADLMAMVGVWLFGAAAGVTLVDRASRPALASALALSVLLFAILVASAVLG